MRYHVVGAAPAEASPVESLGDVPDWSSQGIFLSYQREDAVPYAGLLQCESRDRFPDAWVFMDLDSIEAGVRFAEVIRDTVGPSGVLVALIGRQWLTLADEEGRRLDNPDDFVRFEVQTALERLRGDQTMITANYSRRIRGRRCVMAYAH